MSKTNEYKVLQPIGWNGRREKGEVITLTEEEASSYSSDLITLVTPAPVEEEENIVPLAERDINTLKHAELKTLAAELGLEATGTKADLVDKINLFRAEE